MKYVYLLQSKSDSNERYVGIAENLKKRLSVHNAGGSVHTAKFKPWKLVTFVAFSDPNQALRFERYLKKGSGRSFAKKRLW